MNRTEPMVRAPRRTGTPRRSSAPTAARFLGAGAPRVGLLVGALLLAGCSAFSRPAPSGSLYLLAPDAPARQEGASLGSVFVRRFSATPPFDDRPLLYRTTNGTWRADAYDGFAADPADMMTSALFSALEASGRFSVVAAEGVTGRFDHDAEGTLEAFYADYATGGAPEAVVRMRVYVVRRTGAVREVLSVLPVEARAPIAGDTAGAVVDALSAATSEAMAKVVAALPKEPRATADAAVERPQKAG
ncbi:MAG: hypothetical protein RI967_450 [Planctomycetota bacterium]|jgi:ABC-type uncharacterized transport system auxiliary subunit